MPFEFEKLDIDGVILVKPKVFEDNRGFFIENYKKSDFFSAGITQEFVQENISNSKRGVLRGLHYQVQPFSQAKLIKCTKGRIYDVFVDLRPSSKTFKKWQRVELSESNQMSLYIPEGLAHGFVVLSETAELSYKTTAEYAPEYERGFLWNDKEIGVDWGFDLEQQFTPILSEKDMNLPRFQEINKEELL